MSKLIKSRYNTIMMNQEEQQVVALAATLQALNLVQEIATDGNFDTEKAKPVLQALVSYNPQESIDAYGGEISGLSQGLDLLQQLFTENPNRDLSQYLLIVIAIELKLVKNPHMRDILQSDIQRIADMVHTQSKSSEGDDSYNNEDSLISDGVLSEFASLYKQTASQTEPRIMVKGNQEFLQQESSANQIRTLLLAALRGASFYRHNGGKRFDLMMKRKSYLEIIKRWKSH